MKVFSFLLPLAILCVKNYPVEGEILPYSDQCPNITGMQEFDYTRLTGFWFDVKHTKNIPLHCIYYYHEIASPDVYHTRFSALDSNNTKMNLNISLSFAKNKRPDSWCADVNEGYIIKEKVVIVYTDYDSLTIAYVCYVDDKGNVIETLQIESRTETYDKARVEKILAEHNLTRFKLHDAYKNCPKVQH